MSLLLNNLITYAKAALTKAQRAAGANYVVGYNSTSGAMVSHTGGVISSGGAGITDGDKGDIIVSSSGAVWQVDPVPTKSRLAITQADVASNAPVALTTATSLVAATHGNRQITFTGANATLTVTNDATGGWTGDSEILVQTLAGSAGVPTISTPDGKSVAGTTSQPIGAKRKGSNSWDVYLLPQSTAGGSGTVITNLTSYTATSNFTGVTTESAAQKTITLGTLAAGQRVKIVGAITGSNTNDTTTLRIKVGAGTVGTLVTGTFSVLDGFRSEIVCTGSATQLTISQKIFSGGTLASTVKTTVDTSASVDLTFTLQNSTTTRTAAIEGVHVEVYPA